jgi:hypothetical protein
VISFDFHGHEQKPKQIDGQIRQTGRQTDKQDFNGNNVEFVLATLIIIITIMSQGQPTDRVPNEEIRCFTQLVLFPYRSKGDTIECETTNLCYCLLYHSKDIRLGFLQ